MLLLDAGAGFPILGMQLSDASLRPASYILTGEINQPVTWSSSRDIPVVVTRKELLYTVMELNKQQQHTSQE